MYSIKLVGLLERCGRFDEAEKILVRALSYFEECYGEDHPRTMHTIETLTGTYRGQGRADMVEQMQLRPIRARTRALGDNHPSTITAKMNLALTLFLQTTWKKQKHWVLRF